MDRRRLALKIGAILFLLLGMAVFMLSYSVSSDSANAAPRSNLMLIIMVMNAVVIVGIAVVKTIVRRSGDPRKRKNEDLGEFYAVNDLGEVVLGDDGELVYFDEKPKREDDLL